MVFNFDNIPAHPVSAAGEPELVSTIVDLLAAAPRPLTLTEVVTVLNDSEINTPADTTVRAYQNRATAEGRISKLSRQSYAGPVAEGEAQVETETETEEADPLADL